MKDNNAVEVIREKMKDIKPDIKEANRIAKIMKKDIRFSELYVSKIDDCEKFQSQSETADEVQVKMENFETGAIHIWAVEKFQDRLVEMKEALNVYENNQRMEPEADPFNQKQEPIFLGQAFYSLEGLGYLMDNPHTLPIVGTDMQAVGQLTMNVLPCYADGNEDIDEEQCPDDPSELISQPLDFKVSISHATNLPENFCRDVYCEYKFYLDDTLYKTEVIEGKN